MTVQIVTGPTVAAPHPAPHTGGLLDVAEIHEGMAWVDPEDMFVSWNCAYPASVELCGTDETPDKLFRDPKVVDGTRFAVYLGGLCKPLTEDVLTEIDRVFALRESRQVEKNFEAAVLGVAPLLSGTPADAAHALAMMENALGDQYAGVGTIHMSPLIATLLFHDDLLIKVDGKYYTNLGTKVVVGVGYTSLAMYGSGDIQVWRSERILVEQPSTAQNTQVALAERAYIVAGDCVALRLDNIPTTATQSAPIPGDPLPDVSLETGTNELVGPGDSWFPPMGNLRSVTVVVTNGTLNVDGTEVTAPDSVSFDADNNETLDPPAISATGSGDRGYVSWVAVV